VITHGELDKLLSIRTPEESVLSLYLKVPLDPAGLRELSARAHDLIMSAAGALGPPPTDDELVARDAVAAHARQWLGHTLAIFVCGDLGLREVVPLPGPSCERAVWAVRPHVRPLLAAVQRHPDHRIAVIDRRHAWLFAVTSDGIVTMTSETSGQAPGATAGDGHGLEADHIRRRMKELARHHYQDAAVLLEQAAHRWGPQPLVLGGQTDSMKQLLAALSPEVRDQYAGCFAADPHVLTSARAGELAAPVIARRAELQERQLVQQITGQTADVRAAIGLNGCLAAVNSAAADLLLIPDEGVVPGYHCERCGVLSVTGEECCDWGAASRAVPDLLEEMALRTLASDGEVIAARELRIEAIAARLRPHALD
jgi:hypothetical protein